MVTAPRVLTALRQQAPAPRARSGRGPVLAARTGRKAAHSRRRASSRAGDWAPAGDDVDWELAEPPPGDSSDEEDLFLEEGGWGGPGFALQNALAVGLVALLALAASDVLIKLLVVAYALVAAGFRYTLVALLLLVIISLFR